jgi:hypothetical protein
VVLRATPHGFSLEELRAWVVRQLTNAHAMVELGFRGKSHCGAVAWNAYLLVDDLVQRHPHLEPIDPDNPVRELSLDLAIAELRKVRRWCEGCMSQQPPENPPKEVLVTDWRQNIAVDVQASIITLRGMKYSVDPDVAAFVDALIKLEGERQRFAKLAEGVPALAGQTNATRLKAKIPPDVLKVIEFVPGSGCRLLLKELK